MTDYAATGTLSMRGMEVRLRRLHPILARSTAMTFCTPDDGGHARMRLASTHSEKPGHWGNLNTVSPQLLCSPRFKPTL